MGDTDEGHAACVAAWFERTAAEGWPAARLLDLLERACEALWARLRPTLGDVTLAAIVDRVAHAAAARFAPFAALEVGPAGLRFDAMRARAGEWRDGELAPAVRFVLVELLTVLGNLTAEVLTPALHATLGGVTLEAPRGPPGGERRARAAPAAAAPRGGRRKKP